MDLFETSLSFEQLVGNEPVNNILENVSTKIFDHRNHVVANIVSILIQNSKTVFEDGRILFLAPELQAKINKILHSQGYIFRIENEITNCIWVSSSSHALISDSLPDFHFKFKKLLSPDLYYGQCLIIEFENSIDAIIGLIRICDLANDWKVGFGSVSIHLVYFLSIFRKLMAVIVCGRIVFLLVGLMLVLKQILNNFGYLCIHRI